ncbi:MAG TPA: flagellar hook-associated protein FlgK [Rhizomicrobium sp.]|nr:flagellar hook-associated protein FlgK [Rhizomicrobium sp.]
MSLNGILSSALSALQTNTAALKVVSDNVANINTPGYARRVVNQQTQVSGGVLTGVSIADIQRVTDQFLQAETLAANAGSSQYSTQSNIYTQLNGLLGQPGDSTSLTSQLSNIFSALGNASLSPSSSTSQQAVLTSLQGLASSISSVSNSISALQSQVDGQVTSSISTVNSLIKNIYDLNQQIQNATLAGDTATGLLDQRDQAVQSLSAMIGVRTSEQPNGQLVVSTQDGVNLVGDTYAQLSYSGGSTNGVYGQISMINIGPGGEQIGQSQALDPHLGSGSIEGLIDMRDNQLPALQQELGNFARQTALAFNKQANANSAAPPPSSLNGRNTGLLGTDGMNFTGKTTIAVADSSGNLVSRIDVDFDAGTLSVDGGPSVSIGTTIDDFTSALNGALGADGTASFSNGELSISAAGGNGIVVQDDSTDPSSRGGTGFSQFFGLNDIFESSAPSILATGLSASDDAGFSSGTINFTLRDSSGNIDKQASVTLSAGMTIGDVVSALNTALGGAGTFTLGSDGSMSFAPSAANSGDTLNVTNDTSQRGTTGMSFTELFGIGANQAAAQAQGFVVNPNLVASPSSLPFAQANIDSTTVAGDSILGSGDARGLIALQNLANAQQSFGAAGSMGAQLSTLANYAANFYQDVSTRSTAASTSATTQSDRLSEAQSRQSSESGVNLDEELSNMMIYQQAYAAGARMLQVGQQLYDTLLQMPV